MERPDPLFLPRVEWLAFQGRFLADSRESAIHEVMKTLAGPSGVSVCRTRGFRPSSNLVSDVFCRSGMSFLRRWFGPKDGPSRGRADHTLAQRVRELERQAEDAPLGTRATLLNRAGDVCMRAGDHPRALEYFRQAIDLLLEDEQPEPARGVAKKIIRVHPETVRTHCTLTWLDLATRQDAGAVKSLRDYVNAAERHGQIDQAGQEILEMARIASHRGFLEEVAQHLKAMGFPGESDQVMEWALAGGAPEAGGDPQELSRRCMSSAIASKSGPQRDRTRS